VRHTSTDSADTADTASSFHSTTLTVAVVAGLVTFGTVAVQLSASGMFLGWVAYGIAATTVRQGYANLASFVIGLALGVGVTLIINALTPSLGLAATGISIFALVAVVMCLRNLAPIDNPLTYFLGITSFFYSQLPPTVGSFALLAVAGAVGATGAAVAGALQTGLAHLRARAAASPSQVSTATERE
jgi:hypothetical protein